MTVRNNGTKGVHFVGVFNLVEGTANIHKPLLNIICLRLPVSSRESHQNALHLFSDHNVWSLALDPFVTLFCALGTTVAFVYWPGGSGATWHPWTPLSARFVQARGIVVVAQVIVKSSSFIGRAFTWIILNREWVGVHGCYVLIQAKFLESFNDHWVPCPVMGGVLPLENYAGWHHWYGTTGCQ